MSCTNIEWTAFKDTVVWMRDILTGLAALSAIIFGFRGYAIWHRQLKGKNEYDVSMSLLVTLKKLLRSVGYLRNPRFTDAEITSAKRTVMMEDFSFFNSLDSAQRDRYIRSVAIYERNNEVREIADKLTDVHTDFQVLIGEEIDEPIIRIHRELWTILIVTKEHADRIRPTQMSINETPAHSDQRILEAEYVFEKDTNDIVSLRLKQAEAEISDILKKYIHP